MSTSTLHPLAAAYLRQVRREGRGLSGNRPAELLVDLDEHLSAAIPAEVPDEEARAVLARFGEPRVIIEAERPQGSTVAERRGTREWMAVFLLLVGFVAAGVGWVLGVVLLWRSRAWTRRDKLIATLVLPGGLFATVLLLLLALGRSHKSTQLGACHLSTHHKNRWPLLARSLAGASIARESRKLATD